MDIHLIIKNELFNHIGKENAITSTEICNMLNINDDAGTRYITRKLVKETTEKYSLPILSCRNGFYLASNASELYEYNKNMNTRIQSMEERRDKVNKNYNTYMSQIKNNIA